MEIFVQEKLCRHIPERVEEVETRCAAVITGVGTRETAAVVDMWDQNLGQNQPSDIRLPQSKG